jgi:hypothetical protein
MTSYVTRTAGLGISEDQPNGLEIGDSVTRAMIGNDENWDYHIQHGNIVRAGGPHDPAVIAALSEDEVPEDPKDQRIRELEEQLDLLAGRQGTPAAGTHLSDLADNGDDEEADAEPVRAEKVPASAKSVDAAAGASDTAK